MNYIFAITKDNPGCYTDMDPDNEKDIYVPAKNGWQEAQKWIPFSFPEKVFVKGFDQKSRFESMKSNIENLLKELDRSNKISTFAILIDQVGPVQFEINQFSKFGFRYQILVNKH